MKKFFNSETTSPFVLAKFCTERWFMMEAIKTMHLHQVTSWPALIIFMHVQSQSK